MEMNQISIIQRDLRLERWFLKVQFPTRSCISSPSPPFRLSGKFSQTFVPDQNILLISSLLDASEIMTDLFWHWIKKVQDPKGLEEEGKSRLLASFFFFFFLSSPWLAFILGHLDQCSLISKELPLLIACLFYFVSKVFTKILGQNPCLTLSSILIFPLGTYW